MSSEGLVSLSWNVEMTETDLVSLSTFDENKGQSPVSVELHPGSDFTDITNLEIEQFSVTQMRGKIMKI